MSGQIDAVFTWVDGDDPAFIASKRDHAARWSTTTPAGWEERSAYTGAAEARERSVLASHSQARFRSKDELRFALRSINQNAPWIRHIHIVTNGQVPPWLDARHPRISVVTHDRLFEDMHCLPTFNSNAIESTIHRIAGLSDDFIYFNDDFFIGRPVDASAFIDEVGRHRLFVEGTRKMPRDMTDRSMIAHSWAFNHALLNDRVEASTSRRMFAHTPQIYNKHVLAEIQLVWREHFERTRRNRFRTAFDAAFRLLYTSYAGENRRPLISQGDTTNFGVITPVDEQTYAFIKVGDPKTDYRAAMARTLSVRPAFFCVNDELPDDAGAQEEEAVALLTRNFLLSFFPEASPFEATPLSRIAGDDGAGLGVIAQDRPERPASAPIRIGTPLKIGLKGFAPEPRCGWHESEPDGVWTRGAEGRLSLQVDPATAPGFALRLTGSVIGSALPGGRLVRMIVQLGSDGEGAIVSEALIASDDFFTLVAPAPQPPTAWDGQVNLTLERLIAPSPAQLGRAPDYRALGVYLSEIELIADVHGSDVAPSDLHVLAVDAPLPMTDALS